MSSPQDSALSQLDGCGMNLVLVRSRSQYAMYASSAAKSVSTSVFLTAAFHAVRAAAGLTFRG